LQRNEFLSTGERVPVRNACTAHLRHLFTAARRVALAAALVLLGCESLQNAIANGDTRTISFHHLHTGEDLTVTFKRNGRYDEDALKKINWLMRDWRRDEEVRMDPHLLDLVWEAHREVGAREAIRVICGYRAPATNEMLRQRSRDSGVARASLHTLGKAIDFQIPGVSLDALRTAGLRQQRGGVGFYPASGSPFVHLDVGSVRHWPRMTREELVRVFPNERTVHVPADGQPLAGYALALADIEKRGGTTSAPSLETAQRSGATAPKPNLFARLFGFGKAKDADADEADATAPAAPKVAAAKPVPAKPLAIAARETPRSEAAVPLPRAKPVATQVIARPSAVPARTTVAAAAPSDVFSARGYWQGLPESEPFKLAAVESSAVRRRGPDAASADPAATASIGPFPAPAKPSPDITLAYAAPSEPPAARATPMGGGVPRAAATAAGHSIARKIAPERSPDAPPAPVAALAPSAFSQRSDDPWLRAVMIAPSIERSMKTTLLGTTDYRALSPLMQKPDSLLMMQFSADPHLGMTHDRFSGGAVHFLATASFVASAVR
jgi:uncharacterized protein YcbK (DUF882 family)